MEHGTVARDSDAKLGIDLAYELQGGFALPVARFVRAIDEHDLREHRYEARSVGSGALTAVEALGDLQYLSRREAQTVLVTRLGATYALISLHMEWAQIEVAGPDRGHVDEICELILERLPPPLEDALTAPASFWANAQHGAQRRHRRLSVQPWDEIARNYAAVTARGLEGLLAARDPEEGNLILWHGDPGTGKTSALRALAYEWREWCAVHVVVDPEHFLGRETSAYMLEVLSAPDIETPTREHRLVVLEDSGELLTADAHERTGQGLSRLLNLTDGLLGQGLNATVMITTNEPLGRLHPAMKRPGRCLQELEFDVLSGAESNRWLALAGSNARVDGSQALAGLYAIASGRVEPTLEKPRIGFG